MQISQPLSYYPEFFSVTVTVAQLIIYSVFTLLILCIIYASRGLSQSVFRYLQAHLGFKRSKQDCNARQIKSPDCNDDGDPALIDMSKMLDKVVDSMLHSQYLMKDKKRYSSVYQTPFRDNLITLKNLSNELRRNALTEQVDGINLAHNPSFDNAQPRNKRRGASKIVSSVQIVQDILPPLQDYAMRSGISLSFSEQANGQLNMPSGISDKLLRKLILNAIRYNPAGTSITLQCAANEHFLCFTIHDNGTGVCARYTDKVFQQNSRKHIPRLRRLSDAETQLDLSTIAYVARQFNGELSIRSALGIGTSVTLMLPLQLVQPSPHLAKKIPRVSSSASHQVRVSARKKAVFIGKHESVHNKLDERFSESYAWFAFCSIDRALADIFDILPDIIIVDFSWQNALCVQLSEFLRASNEFSTTPLIMLTSSVDTRARVAAYSAGVTAIVEKPLDVDELKVVMENVLETKRLLMRADKQSNNDTRDDASEGFTYSYSSRSDKKESQATVEEPQSTSYETQQLATQDMFCRQLESLIGEHYQDESLKVSDISTLMHMSEKTLQRRIKKHYNLSFKLFLRQYRLENARRLLLEGKGITEVSFEVGYSSSSYFGKCFKQWYGYPPSFISRAD
ncbi:helix-turn-helix domain-containing protein [Ningiella sp. W23]|uniref:hybrid sensor histidine kinase/response regulator transcription factor n=1 Tax=Ningiella sp. W23 TaxID=3023715 RepID=UPI003756C5FC